METLTTIAQAVAVTIATGGLEALGGQAGRSAVAAVGRHIDGLRQRFLVASGVGGRKVLEAAVERPDAAAVNALATAVEALAVRDDGFRAELRQLAEELEAAQPGASVQIAQKISNIGSVSVQHDFNLHL